MQTISTPTDFRRQRSGATLTEVLMAMMIMAIGVSMVMSLFPISVLRTLQATQLTNATILSQNVKTLLEMDSNIAFDPDYNNNSLEHTTSGNQNYIVDPVGYGVRYGDSTIAGSRNFGWRDNLIVNGAPDTEDVNDDGIWVAPEDTILANGVHDSEWFSGLPRFGGFAYPNTITDPPVTAEESRALREFARTIGIQGDGWTVQYDGLPTGLIQSTAGRIVGVTIDDTVDLSDIPYSNHPTFGVPGVATNQLIPDPENTRIVVFSIDESISQSFPLTQISEDIDHDGTLDPGEDTNGNGVLDSNVIYWTEDFDRDDLFTPPATGIDVDLNLDGALDQRGLPEEFFVDTDADGDADAPVIGRVMLLTRRASDFNWLLTVRRRDDDTARSIDIVVRYKDGVDNAEEQLFRATFVPNTPFVGIDVGTSNTPEIARGKFIFNSSTAKWYRIQDVQKRPSLGWSQAGAASAGIHDNYEFVIILDENIRGTDAAGLDGSNLALDGQEITDWSDTSDEFGLAMFPKSVVEVYPIGYFLR